MKEYSLVFLKETKANIGAPDIEPKGPHYCKGYPSGLDSPQPIA
jgi:hypothetical protein